MNSLSSCDAITHAGAPLEEAADGPGQQMIDWGSFLVMPSPTSEGSIDKGATPPRGLQLLNGTGSRGFSMARTLGSEDADQVTSKVQCGCAGIKYMLHVVTCRKTGNRGPVKFLLVT